MEKNQEWLKILPKYDKIWLKESLELVKQCSDYENLDPIDLLKISLLFSRQARFQEAKSLLLIAIEKNAQRPDIWTLLGILNKQLKEFKEAESNYRRAIEIDPTYPYAWFSLGTLNEYNNSLEKTEKYFRKAIELENDDVFIQHLGYFLLENKRYNEAKTILESLTHDFPTNAQGFYFLGTLYSQLKDIKNAKRCFQKGLKIKNISKPVKHALKISLNKLCERS